ncbi:hypothetical protein KSD_01400 [Ktedonobacter sp. SOSP1-85]|nr:hypothetical protein KSD_01400 [Ktedonobacter sp. SOSP1-85]
MPVGVAILKQVPVRRNGTYVLTWLLAHSVSLLMGWSIPRELVDWRSGLP